MQQRFGITMHLCTEETMHHMITQCNTTRYDITTFGLWKNSTNDCFNVMHQDMTSPHLWTLEKQHT
jgi:hypothetical protein